MIAVACLSLCAPAIIYTFPTTISENRVRLPTRLHTRPTERARTCPQPYAARKYRQLYTAITSGQVKHPVIMHMHVRVLINARPVGMGVTKVQIFW
jgi:hypothetical protein